ncbi:hypothetical protein, partial [Rhodopirellula bahusiensis]|uniref:hypothetical protein n=1 Tax=Rhodopirellula bahusiensis TaxID=2014065 RepID=UPI003298DBC1
MSFPGPIELIVIGGMLLVTLGIPLAILVSLIFSLDAKIVNSLLISDRSFVNPMDIADLNSRRNTSQRFESDRAVSPPIDQLPNRVKRIAARPEYKMKSFI